MATVVVSVPSWAAAAAAAVVVVVVVEVVEVEGGDSLIEKVAAVVGGDDDSEMLEFDLDSRSDSLDRPEKVRDLISSMINWAACAIR